jgi:hypothetical protein
MAVHAKGRDSQLIRCPLRIQDPATDFFTSVALTLILAAWFPPRPRLSRQFERLSRHRNGNGMKLHSEGGNSPRFVWL